MTNNQDYYSLLGIPRNASAEDIRQAYFDSARRLHPDKNIAPGETELFIDVQEAYEVLSNPKKRASYDTSLPPEREQFHPIEHRILFSRSNLIQLDEPQLVYVLLEFSPKPGATQPAAPPLNICLVIDRSSSMQGVYIDVVKETANQIARNLKDNDYFSLVTFSDRAEVVIPAERNADLKKLGARIQMIQCSGGTEIFSGLESGYNEIIRNQRNSPSNHIILLTDGRTYGDEAKCIDLARRAAEKGITIRGLGIGPEWNDSFMDELTSLTGGSSMYISRPQDIQRILLKQISQMAVSYAEETRVEFMIPDGTELHYAFRITPDPGLLPLTSPILMGPVFKDGCLQILMEFLVHSSSEKDKASLLEGKVFITLNDPISKSVSFPLMIQRPIKNESSKDPPAAEIVSALSKLTLYRLQEQVHLEAEAGEFDKAAEHLQRLATHLLACGERGLARTVLLEAEEISKRKSLSQEGQKEIKYGTRALIVSGERNKYGNLS
jgi:Ca-activated chloride channel family protein